MDEEQVEQEWINDSDHERRVRVYDMGGDFFLDIPSGARITFGYFNPGAPKFNDDGRGYGAPRASQVARATALRVYADSTDKRQLACFLDVRGFRDESIKLTKIIKKVTVEQHLIDDGEGTVEFGAKQAKVLKAIPEATSYDDDGDNPF